MYHEIYMKVGEISPIRKNGQFSHSLFFEDTWPIGGDGKKMHFFFTAHQGYWFCYEKVTKQKLEFKDMRWRRINQWKKRKRKEKRTSREYTKTKRLKGLKSSTPFLGSNLDYLRNTNSKNTSKRLGLRLSRTPRRAFDNLFLYYFFIYLFLITVMGAIYICF